MKLPKVKLVHNTDRDHSQKRVVKRAFSNLFVRIKSMDKRLAGIRVNLKMEFVFSKDRIQRTENWIMKLQHGVSSKIRNKIKRKFQFSNKQSARIPRTDFRKKAVYSNSSKQLTEEQL